MFIATFNKQSKLGEKPRKIETREELGFFVFLIWFFVVVVVLLFGF